jgi:hypothetical protein
VLANAAPGEGFVLGPWEARVLRRPAG